MNPVDHPMGGRTRVVVLLKAKWKIKYGPSTKSKKSHNLIIILPEKVKKKRVKLKKQQNIINTKIYVPFLPTLWLIFDAAILNTPLDLLHEQHTSSLSRNLS